jgi:nucleotide-binding universal stress UspA family protein
MAPTEVGPKVPSGPVLFAYDGSELSALAFDQAASQLATGRDALVLCVWQPADVGFVPINNRHFDAYQASEVEAAAQETAEQGASLAKKAGFASQGIVVQAAPTWKGIIHTAEERKASLIVLGSHRRTGLGHLLGSVAAAVVAHSASSVLVVRSLQVD